MTTTRPKAHEIGWPLTPGVVADINENFQALFDDVRLVGADVEGVVSVPRGGTGLSSWVIGDILYASATTTIAGLASVAKGAVLVSGGVATAPAYLAAGTSGYVLTAAGAGSDPSWANPNHNLLSARHSDTTVAGVTRGDIITGQGASPTWARLAVGTLGYFLRSAGAGADVAWSNDGSVLTSIPETAITDGSLLARVAGNERITGAWRFDYGVSIGAANVATQFLVNLTSTGDWLATFTNNALTPNNYGIRLIAGTSSADTSFKVERPAGTLNLELRGDGALKWGGVASTFLTSSSTAVTPGTYGSATESAQITVDQGGRITAASNVAISALPAAHDILSVSHGDTLAGSVARGSIIVGNATPKWSALAIGTTGKVLWSDGTDASWTGTPVIATSISVPSIVTASGALTITPAAGSGVSLVLSTTGDFVVNTNHLVVDTSAGRVGIGTASPSYPLHVYSTATGSPATTTLGVNMARSIITFDTFDAAGPVYYSRITATNMGGGDFFQVAASAGGLILDGDTHNLRTVAGTSRLFINSSGNVGIGTTGPDAKLDVLSTTEQLRLTYTDGSVYTSFTVDSAGMMKFKATGNKCLFTTTAGDIGDAGSFLFQCTANDSGTYTGLFYNSHSSGYGVQINAGSSVSHTVLLLNTAAGGELARLYADGSLTVGAPTGGAKGAGTVNAQAVYDDNTLLTDWVFDLYYDGKTDLAMPPDARLWNLTDTRSVVQTLHKLPWMPHQSQFEAERSLGNLVTGLWWGQEQQQLYIQELEARIADLEARQI